MTPRPAFSAYGVELEYMIVDRRSLDVRPIADALLRDERGRVVNELARGRLGWSNELTLHLIEIKNRLPAPDLAPLAAALQAEVAELDRRLAPLGARLMPGGMHPCMDPTCECRLWPHGQAGIYRTYERIFGCHRHGFANIQSAHLNLPFADDGEFARLHAAVRLLLPILPALAASSPIADGRADGHLDTRLVAYLVHQDRIPASLGEATIPEAGVASQVEYRQRILAPMYRQASALDPEGILRHEWLNSRGAIPRFERMALEIRLLDMQEYPRADLAVAAAVGAVARRLYRMGEGGDLARQQAYPGASLATLLRACLRDGERARIDDPVYLELLGLAPVPIEVGAAWHRLVEAWWAAEPTARSTWGEPLETILTHGPLARRILRAAGPDLSRPHLAAIYAELCDCLAQGHSFLPS